MPDSLEASLIDDHAVVVCRHASLLEAIAALRRANFTAIWVVEADSTGQRRLLGAVFPAQLLQATLTGPPPLESRVESIMVRDLPVLDLAALTSFETCLRHFTQSHADFLPVVDSDHAFVGVISQWQLLQHYHPINSLNHLPKAFECSADGFLLALCEAPIEQASSAGQTPDLKQVLANQRITDVNEAFLKQHGISRTAIVGRALADVGPLNLAYETLSWQQFFAAGATSATVERRSEAGPRWFEAHYTCLYDSQGRIVGHFCIQRDASYYQEIETRLMRQERYLYVIVAIQQQLLAAGHHFLTRPFNSPAELLEKSDRPGLRSTLRALRPLYQEILKQLGETAQASRVYLFENHDNCMSQQLEWCAAGISPEIDNPLLQNLPYEDFFPRWLQTLSQGEPINGVVSEFPESERSVLVGQNILSILVLPLIVEKEFWGFIGFDNCQTATPWDESEVALLAAGAAALAMHLESCQVACLLQQTWHRERFAHQLINQMWRTLQIDDVLQTTTNQLRYLLRCDRTVVYRFNSDWSGSFVAESVSPDWTPLTQLYTHTPHLAEAAVSGDTCQIKSWQTSPAAALDTYLQSHQGGAYREGKPYSCVVDIHQANFAPCYVDLLSRMEVRAYLTIPIFVGDRLWGLLANYQNSQPHQWQADEIDLGLRITTQLGIALQQVELLEQTRQQSIELAKANAAAESAMQAKADFLANVSHELRTPLNAILGFSDILSDELPSEPNNATTAEHREYLDIISRNGRGLLTSINHVLAVARLDAGHSQLLTQTFDLHQLLQEVQSWLNLEATAKGLALTFHWSPALPQTIVSDRDKLRQVLINLSENAIKFTSAGRVTLRAYVRNQVALDAKTTRLNLAFEVEDTGHGIAPEEIDNLFQPFYKSQAGRQSGQGTGLGLTVSEKFVHLLGGNITVNSTIHQGSLFQFNIWATTGINETAAAASPIPAHAPEIKAPSPYRIVIVDSQSQDHYRLKQILSPLGFDLRTVNSSHEALAICLEWHPHLLFVDLPEAFINGQAITQQLRQQAQNSAHVEESFLPPKAIALLTQEPDQTALDWANSNFDDVLSWPSHDSELLELLSQHLPLTHLVYQAPALSVPLESQPSPFTQQREAIKLLPLSWRQQLHQAALIGSDQKVTSLIAQLPTEQISLIRLLKTLTENFQFDQIIALLASEQ